MNKSFGVSFISSYVPRQCGIATFTSDLARSVRNHSNGIKNNISVTALNDIAKGYRYPGEVKFEVNDKLSTDYKEAAYYLNLSDSDVINLQHEFGLYGGEAGSNILYLMENLKKPVISTLHTVLENPDSDQMRVIEEIAGRSHSLVVQSNRAVGMLENIYKIAKEKIRYIPHGAHDVPFLDTSYYKDKFQLAGKKVILTFGLLGPGKGVEDVINAMVRITSEFKDVVFIVLGATHPNVKRQFGEAYRNSLENLALKHGIENNVIFINRFVNTQELLEFLLMSDIYVSPYHHKEQIVSGTLTYALACGKAVVSTPYWHAEEMLKDDCGMLVPFRDPGAISESVIQILKDENLRNRIRKNAYDKGRNMIWPQVGRDYLDLFHEAVEEFRNSFNRHIPTVRYKSFPSLPEVNMAHLERLTDNVGILQHSNFSVPNRNEGYCSDDNCRALLVAGLNRLLFNDTSLDSQISTYFSFINYAYNPKTKLFRNFFSYDRRWLEEAGSEDSNGRILFVLGYIIKNSSDYSYLSLSKSLFESSVKSMENFKSIRAMAWIAMGCIFYLNRFSGARDIKRICRKLLEKIYVSYTAESSKGWKWFEEVLTYDNARLPQSLLMGGQFFNIEKFKKAGLESLEWFSSVIHNEGNSFISPVGNDGWYQKGKIKSKFDQQPLEIPALIDAYYQAYKVTEDEEWIRRIGIAFSWFLGNNDREEPLYDFVTGGCCDGLTATSLNRNQGAESTISWLLSLLRMIQIRQELQVEKNRKESASPLVLEHA